MLNEILKAAVTGYTPVLVMMLIDLITGVLKAMKKHSVKSARLRNSINKLIIYFVVLIIGGCLTTSGEEGVGGIFVVLICLIEGVSIVENLSELVPGLKITDRLKKLLRLKIEEKTKE